MKLLQAAALLSFAMLCAVLAWHASDTNIKLAVFLAGLALILAITGASLIADWIVERADEHAMARAMAEATTKESVLAEAISQLGENQTWIFARQAVEAIGYVNLNGRPIFSIETMGVKIPLYFIAEFITGGTNEKLSNGDDAYFLPPVRRWSDKTNERKWAETLTAFFIGERWAIPHAGNNSARLLVPWQKLAYHFGVLDDEYQGE